jgi:hypothetical protein
VLEPAFLSKLTMIEVNKKGLPRLISGKLVGEEVRDKLVLLGSEYPIPP